MAVCKSAGKGVALSMVAECAVRSSLTKRKKLRQDGRAVPVTRGDSVPHYLPDAVLVKLVLDQAETKQLFGFAFRLSFGDHRYAAATRFAVSSARRL